MTLIALFIIGALNIASAAAFLGGFKSTVRTGYGTLLFTVILGAIEVALAFSLALQTGSNLVLAAAWVTLAFNIIGVVRAGLWQNKVYDPSRGYLVLIMVVNLATIVAFFAGSMSVAA